ncbi:hypothetical protein ACPW96_16455 [Micromonospora sp. DT81.3]|uniref:arsenate reductase/protein-tyrosine-phosphatase family protein n=1 Tax=Micromonospora sp. DT81.3 TaxID=3416523 RepID=UPI003CFAE45D
MANVCRSPLMEIVLSTQVDADRSDVAVTSAGTEVGRASHMCDIAARLIPNNPAAREAAELHTPRAVTGEVIASQDLIITAARLERSQIAKIDPSARAKTFTLREAIALGEADMTAPERKQFERAAAAGVSVAAVYADLLNGRRGRVLPPRETGMRLPWHPPANPMDIPDVHGAGWHRHQSQLRALRAHTSHFGRQWGEIAAQFGSVPRRTF